MIRVFFLRAVDLGQVAEVEAGQLQVLPRQGGLALGAELAEDAAVPLQGRVDLLHAPLTLALLLGGVVGQVAALVGAVPLVAPAHDAGAALGACSGLAQNRIRVTTRVYPGSNTDTVLKGFTFRGSNRLIILMAYPSQLPVLYLNPLEQAGTYSCSFAISRSTR
ncbi:hypothetical protein POKO110462_18965 [Pontibacter korlensis]|uniref:Uncharacterized protein n=1 Tax=Pontibacter korlensis TaxID=400092 RepID=A0A0E3UVP8_9BACT|nr:hypothetical protein PKOR_01400 [Pontibacter korlensis]